MWAMVSVMFHYYNSIAMNTIEQRHRAFFCYMLQHPEVVQEFVQLALDQEVQTCVDWETLALHQAPLCDEDTKGVCAHIVYKVMTKDRRTTLVFLLGHMWEPDRLLHVHTLKYVTKTLEEQADNKPPLLIRLTLYNGEVYPYPHPKTFFECFENPALARMVHMHGPIIVDTPENPYPYPRTIFDYYEDTNLARKVFYDAHRLIDFRDYSDQELLTYEHASVLALAMKHVNDPALSDWMKANEAIVKKLKASPYAERVWEYLLSA